MLGIAASPVVGFDAPFPRIETTEKLYIQVKWASNLASSAPLSAPFASSLEPANHCPVLPGPNSASSEVCIRGPF
jgi:hypothetical protein